MEGTVKWFNGEKGYGFIEGDNGDFFVHSSQLNGQVLNEGDRVTFEPVEGDRGPQAHDVQIKKDE